MSQDSNKAFEGWAILELMGHRKLAGTISEETIGGHSFIRIDVPGEGCNVATQFYSPTAVYCLTPCTEQLARDFAAGCKPRPVTEYDIPRRPVLTGPSVDEDEEGYGLGEDSEPL